MAKRPALEALDAMEDVASPAPKRQKSQGPGEDGANGLGNGKKKVEGDVVEAVAEEEEDDDEMEAAEAPAPIRQEAPSAGYSDLYLDTIDRNVLDFDFEKLCSVSLSNINVYACLVCGRYYQGRGPRSHAYFHALDEDHHVFINMQTQRVYVLPEGYEVRSRSLDDIKYVADPRYTRADVAVLDRPGLTAGASAAASAHRTLAGRPYTPGYVGMNNIKENDYLNVVVQALAHVAPLRNFFLLDEEATQRSGGGGGEAAAANRELVRRFGLLVRKIWNPRAFKAHVSPHELLQEVALRSSKRFTLTAQSDPADFFAWFLNHLHLGLGGSRSRPGSSIVQRVFQGRVRVASEMLAAVGARAAAAAAADVDVDAMQIDAAPAVLSASLPQLPQPPQPPAGISPFAIPPPPGVTSSLPMGSSRPPPPTFGPPGLSAPGVSSSTSASSSLLPPPPPSASSLPPPPPSSSSALGLPAAQASSTPADPLAPPRPTTEVSRFLLLTLDLPAAPLFQDEQERNIIPQVPLATLLAKYDGQSAREQGDVRRRFRLQAPLPPYLVLHMKRFSANKFVAERNPTIVTFDPQGLDMRPYVDGESGDGSDEPILYDLVANIVHEAVRTGGGDDVAVDSAEERRTWKVQLRDRGGGEAGAAAAAGGRYKDRWVVVQDLFVEPVAGELLYLAESYIQIWERRRVPGSKGKGKKVQNGR